MDFNNLIQSEDITEQFDPSEVANSKVLAIVGYIIPILFFLPAVSNKDSQAAKFYSNQILSILICSVAASIITFIPVIGVIIGGIVNIALLIIRIIGIVDAAGGRVRKLPLIKAIPLEAFK